MLSLGPEAAECVRSPGLRPLRAPSAFLHHKPETSLYRFSGANPSPSHPAPTLQPLATFQHPNYLEGSSSRPCGPRRQGFEHHVLHEDLMHLCVLHQHHLHHV